MTRDWQRGLRYGLEQPLEFWHRVMPVHALLWSAEFRRGILDGIAAAQANRPLVLAGYLDGEPRHVHARGRN